MKLFKRTRVIKGGLARTPGILHVAVSKGNAVINSCLDCLNKKAATLSSRQLKICLAVFCLLFTSLSLRLMWENIRPKTVIGSQAFVPRIPAPAHIGKVLEQRYTTVISPSDFNRVERMKKYLDSMHIVDGAGYNMIMKDQPFLRDSITLFEQLYQRQSIK